MISTITSMRPAALPCAANVPAAAVPTDAYAGSVPVSIGRLLSEPAVSTDRWAVADGFPYGAAPAADADHVYFGTIRGTLEARDTKDGSERWSVKTELLGGGPVLGPGGLYAAAVGGQVYCVDPADGTVRWHNRPEPDAWFVDTPQMARDTVVLRSQGGRLFGLDSATGDLRWARDCRPPVHPAPGVGADGEVLVPEGSHVTALDPVTGQTAWEATLPGEVRGFGAAGDVTLVSWREKAEGMRWTPKVTAFVAGAPAWTTALTDAPCFEDATLGHGKNGLLTTTEGRLVSLDPRTGHVDWQQELSPIARTLSAPVEGSDGRVYVSQQGGTVHRREASTGLRDGERTAPKSSAQSPPTLTADGSLYLMDDAGTVHAVRTRTMTVQDVATPNVPERDRPRIEVGDGWVIIDRVRVPRKAP